MVLYGPWENTAYPMFMHWSVSLGWFWNCNAVNQKASFLCTLCIYIYFSDSLIFGKMYDKENIFFGWIYLFSFYMQTDFIYGVCLKKSMTPTPCLINQKSSDPPLSISNLIMTPLPFCRPLEINNDRSLNLIDWTLLLYTVFSIFKYCQKFLFYNRIYQHFMRHGWSSGDKPDTPLVWVGVLIPTLKFMFLDMSPMAGIFSPVTFFFITPNLHSQWSLLKTTINTNNSHDQQCIPNAKKMQSICILDLSLTPLIMFTN